MTVLFATHSVYLDHLAGPRHPERPERVDAVLAGARHADVRDALVAVEPRAAEMDDLLRVHPAPYLQRIADICRAGGGRLDPDTYASPQSWAAATMAAGAGLTVVDRLRAGDGDAAFCAVRPPGHHATPDQSMGFCFISNIAVVAASLAEQGERVLIFDFDAHHGNGTQDVFFNDPRVLFVSIHQWPLYPGTGWYTEVGGPDARGATVNIPLPPGATGDVYLRAFDEIAAPVIDRFRPTWLLISAGFDAHRHDPITELGLSSADYPALVGRAAECVARGRRVAMLEGGYDLDALQLSTTATLAALAGVAHPGLSEAVTTGGPGNTHIDEVAAFWRREFE